MSFIIRTVELLLIVFLERQVTVYESYSPFQVSVRKTCVREAPQISTVCSIYKFFDWSEEVCLSGS